MYNYNIILQIKEKMLYRNIVCMNLSVATFHHIQSTIGDWTVFPLNTSIQAKYFSKRNVERIEGKIKAYWVHSSIKWGHFLECQGNGQQ